MFLAEKPGSRENADGGNMLNHPALTIEEDDTAEGEDNNCDRLDGAKNGKKWCSDSVPKSLPFCARNMQELYYLARCPPLAPSTPSSPRPSSNLGIRSSKSGSFPCLEGKARNLAKLFSSTSGKKKS